MIADPPVRDDRRCAAPGCRKPLVEITTRHRKYAGDVLLFDPFCSTECCRRYHQQPELEPLDRGISDITNSSKGYGVVHGTRDSYRLCACELCTAAVKTA